MIGTIDLLGFVSSDLLPWMVLQVRQVRSGKLAWPKGRARGNVFFKISDTCLHNYFL